jgi:hypothetical protein
MHLIEYSTDDDIDDEESEPLEHEPFWTSRRIVLTIIILITLIAFLVYSLQGLFYQPPPPLPPTRLPPML